MKRIFILVSLFGLWSCSTDLDETLEQRQQVLTQQATDASHRVSQVEALQCAARLLGGSQTRSVADVRVDYVLDEQSATRGAAGGNDTVAYIFNWGDEDGFAIIAADNRVCPILAYSETGTFANVKGDAVDVNFTSRIGDYVRRGETRASDSDWWGGGDTGKDPVDPPAYDVVKRYGPYMSCAWCWGNSKGINDWDKYIEIEHPGCKIGCVAVATGSIMVHCKERLTYYDIDFPLAEIREGLRYVQGAPDPEIAALPMDTAIDYAAQILYYVGKDVNMKYGEEASGASHYAALSLLKKLGYVIPTNSFKSYNLTSAVAYLDMDNLLLMQGGDETLLIQEDSVYHLWVADGYSILENTKTKRRTPEYIHCDWGMERYSNGWYNGDVFFAENAYYSDMIYCAVQVENPKSVMGDKYRNILDWEAKYGESEH